MLKSDLVQTDKHSTNDLRWRKILRFLSRTNLIKTRRNMPQLLGITKEPLTLSSLREFKNSVIPTKGGITLRLSTVWQQ